MTYRDFIAQAAIQIFANTKIDNSPDYAVLIADIRDNADLAVVKAKELAKSLAGKWNYDTHLKPFFEDMTKQEVLDE